MNEKIGIFKQLGTAFAGIIKPSMYSRLRNQHFGKLLLFVMFISVINIVIHSAIPYFQFVTAESTKDAINNFPDFTYSNGELTLSEPMSIESSGNYIYANTSYDSITTNDASSIVKQLNLGYSNQLMLISKTNTIQYRGGQYTNVSLSDLASVFKITDLDNSNLLSTVQGILIWLFLFCLIFLYPINIITYLITALLFALLGKFIGLITDASFSFKENFSMAIFITAFWVILMNIFKLCIPGIDNNIYRFLIIIIVGIYTYWAQIHRESPIISSSSYNTTDTSSIFVIPNNDIIFDEPPAKNHSTYNNSSSNKQPDTTSTSSSSGFSLRKD